MRAKKILSGVIVGYVDRDITIIVNDCQSISPILNTPVDTCIIAGDTLSFPVSASFVLDDTMVLTATGQLIDLGADFLQPIKGINNVASEFNWGSTCDFVSISPYNITFRVDVINKIH